MLKRSGINWRFWFVLILLTLFAFNWLVDIIQGPSGIKSAIEELDFE